MRKSLIFLLLVLFLCTACSVDYEVHIKSDTDWSCTYDCKTVYGSGNGVVKLCEDDEPVCSIVEKLTANGYVSAQIEKEDDCCADETDWVRTTVPYGAVTVCYD